MFFLRAWALIESHVKEFHITGRAMKGWVLVGLEGFENDGKLKGLDSAGGEFCWEVADEVTLAGDVC